jgi:outer membrane protein assembly factor BamD (BamD/ComL family)
VLSDIQDQIALVDAARGALASGSSNRALELLRQYQRKYPSGSFRPEVAALKIEALQKLGRTTEARALAERFIAENRGSPLAERVARMTRSEKP